MGLQNRNTNLKYVRIADGKFYLSSDKEKTQPYDELAGVIVDMGTRVDEFEGKKVKKMFINLKDAEDTYAVAFPLESSYTSTVVSFLKNADLTQPLVLIPVMKTEKDGKEKRSLLVNQNNKFVKSYFTKEHPNGLPRFKEVMLNGEKKFDKTEYLQFIQDVINNEFKPQLVDVEATSVPVKATNAPAKQVEAFADANDEDFADDLPF